MVNEMDHQEEKNLISDVNFSVDETLRCDKVSSVPFGIPGNMVI